MNLKSHIKSDNLFLGYSIPEVHRLIDDLEALKKYGPKHRIIKHNEKWLSYLEETIGLTAYYVALLHILIDMDIVMDRKQLEVYLNEVS